MQDGCARGELAYADCQYLSLGIERARRQYRNEIAWVDWAQTVLLEGDDSADLANAYGLLREKTRVRRDLFDGTLAESLSADQPNGTSLVAIEDALDECVHTGGRGRSQLAYRGGRNEHPRFP